MEINKQYLVFFKPESFTNTYDHIYTKYEVYDNLIDIPSIRINRIEKILDITHCSNISIDLVKSEHMKIEKAQRFVEYQRLKEEFGQKEKG